MSPQGSTGLSPAGWIRTTGLVFIRNVRYLRAPASRSPGSEARTPHLFTNDRSGSFAALLAGFEPAIACASKVVRPRFTQSVCRLTVQENSGVGVAPTLAPSGGYASLPTSNPARFSTGLQPRPASCLRGLCSLFYVNRTSTRSLSRNAANLWWRVRVLPPMKSGL